MQMKCFHINKKVLFILTNLIVLLFNILCWQRSGRRVVVPNLQDVALERESYKPLVVVKHDKSPLEIYTSYNQNISQLHNNTYIPKQQFINKFNNLSSNHQNSHYIVPAIQQTPVVNCGLIFEGNEDEISKGERWMKDNLKIPISEEEYIEASRDCAVFKRGRGYVDKPLSLEEAAFPLAFSISSFRDVEQTERLLRSIYQPHNLYCLHIDSKSPLLFHQSLHAITNCFPNVWIASRSTKVKWGDISVIMSEMNCLRDLVRYFRGRYKYFINLTAQEFPLRSNLELVRIAKLFNGSNDITGSHLRMERNRVAYKWTHTWSHTYQQTVFFKTHTPKQPYPHSNLTFFKGETHGLFSVKMTEFIVESFHGRSFFKWCSDTGHASEHFWNTLNYNPHLLTPGAYIGDLSLADHYSLHPVIRAKNWVNLYRDQWPCYGKVVRGLCIFSLRDLPWLKNRPELFINKFHLTYQSLAYDCIEELQRNRTRFKRFFNLSYYTNIPTVLYSRKDGIEI